MNQKAIIGGMNMQTTTYFISDMSCGNCKARIEKAV